MFGATRGTGGEPGRDGAAAGRGRIAAEPAAAVVSAQPAQTIAGFGASGAWWPHDLAQFDRGVQERVADLLFTDSGIWLSAYRYNVGAGGLGVANPITAPETFLVSPGVYDWNRDPAGRRFLELAAARSVPMLVGFANSAPAPWTTNGQSMGGSLRRGAEQAYAGYLADVGAHINALGIPLGCVSPMNEPDSTFSGGRQEGMAVPPRQRAQLVHALERELRARHLNSLVAADESSRTGDQFIAELPDWMDRPGAADAVGVLCHHLYDFPDDSTLQHASEMAGGYGKPLWASEICCVNSATGTWGQQFDPTIANAILLANLVARALTQAHDAAFHWWLACSGEMGADPSADPAVPRQPNSLGWNDGLLYYDRNHSLNGNQQIYTTKRFFVMGNFSRYVRPGDRRHDVIGGPAELRVLAFSNSRGWALVVINNADGATAFDVRLPDAHARVRASGAFETSAARDLEPVDLPRVDTGLVSGIVPAQSVTTITATN